MRTAPLSCHQLPQTLPMSPGQSACRQPAGQGEHQEDASAMEAANCCDSMKTTSFPPPTPLPHLLSSCNLASLKIYFPHVQWEKGTMGFFFLVARWFFLFVFFTLPMGTGWGKSMQACSNSAASSISPSGSLPGDAGGIRGLPLDYSGCPWNCWVRRKGEVQEEVNDEQTTKP